MLIDCMIDWVINSNSCSLNTLIGGLLLINYNRHVTQQKNWTYFRVSVSAIEKITNIKYYNTDQTPR